MKLAVVCEDDNGIISVWFPDVTGEQWGEAIDPFIHTGCSTAGTLDDVLDELREAFEE